MFRRTIRWLRAETPFVVVTALVVAAGIYLFFDPGRWRPGSSIISAGLLLAAVLRLFLPAQAVGLLAVRGRLRDVLFYLTAGGVILAVVIRLHTDGSAG